MDVSTPSIRARGWQAKLRWLPLLCLFALSAISAGFVLAQAGADPASVPAPQLAAEPTAEGTAGLATGGRFGVREMVTQADLVGKSLMVLLMRLSLLGWAIRFEMLITFA